RLLAPLRAVCRELGIHCVLPTYEPGPAPDGIYNSAFLLTPDDRALPPYRKTHPFPTERLAAGGWTTPGNDYPVFDTAIGRIGLHICYDGDFPEICRILAVRGAQIICRPSALLRHFEIWDAENRMRAYENHVYHVAANAVGLDAAGTPYFGHSMITSPIGHTLALACAGDSMIVAETSPDPIARVSQGNSVPQRFDHLQDRNVASYTDDLLRPARSSYEPAERIPFA
ncbi:MAG: carbon-nitrogen hydrolase family protein, partial [Kiritimatiellae bacterium]|nr:carbon-nitrogen hydrolase family protein [Kiritimatiellia bacterium]